ncbi:MAG: malonyl-CoA decarboxylase [Leucothrix sp.]
MSTTITSKIFDRTFFNLRSAWQQINSLGSDQPDLSPDLPKAEITLLKQQMRDCLEGKGGNVSARARAAKLGEAYLCLNDKGRLRFLNVLAQDFGVDNEQVSALAHQITSAEAEQLGKLHQQLRNALRPAGLELLKQFNSLPSGVNFLVDMRADLNRLGSRDDAGLRELDKSLKDLLKSWFDVGFLDLVRLSWSTPAAVLEKLIHYEAVHKIRSWSDLKNRLETDRRCFAFFHPRMPDEPIIFVQVALVKSLSDNIQVLLDESAPLEDPFEANTAIFYSITNAQTGLAGVGFGDFLIKRVVADLKDTLPNIKTFSTLSPIPGLRRWLDNQENSSLLPSEKQALQNVQGFTTLHNALSQPSWHLDTDLSVALQKPLMRLTAEYLVNAKHRNRAVDPVANFHLNNGAHLERINWLADTSKKGMRESAGMMVNYLYKLKDIEANHETYRDSAKTITTNNVQALLKKTK